MQRGIREQIDPGPAIVGNGYDLANERSSERVSTDWLSALRALEQSSWAQEALGADFLRVYLAIKWAEFGQFVSEVGEQDWRWYLTHA
jgi:glutamine synthetase